ncbi:hypothetical protein CPHO_00910 [Corynebacterium phocae]|uniref:ATPase AAA n=1 Tax=Corynebacterium phocae TaxID=161895 RepID=A0A1L7D0W0_9CORY|nr:ATP-binding protein [Corynebacterium phocae]APT91720.1 hypothetical protein CPHO_00910 [Corynebacterium phocae]KAA8728580.1 ArsR family transcriptional regulator [Corynebacterium phocae]
MTWNLARLESTLKELRAFGDDTTLIECKRAKSEMPETLGPSLSAFANMPEGGTILLGVDEAAGFVISGVDNPAAMEKRLADFNRQAIKPAPQLEFEHIATLNGAVIAVTVIPVLPTLRPARYKGKPYLRQADGDYVMNSNDLRMVQLASLHSFEAVENDFRIIPGQGMEQLEEGLLRTFLATVRQRSARLSKVNDDTTLLNILNVITQDEQLRLAGLYAMGFYPQSTQPSLAATAAVRVPRSATGIRHKNLDYFSGPLPELLEDTVEWVRRNTTTTSQYDQKGFLIDVPEFPPSAIRELVANALVHRDLGVSLEVGQQVEIRITDTALIIQNPGGLKGLSPAQLTSPQLTKVAVNQRLYEIAKYLETADGQRIIEGEGGGIREVLIALKERGLPAPEFIDNGVSFKVLLRRGSRFNQEEIDWVNSLNDDLSPIEQDILITLRRGETYSFSRLQNEFSPYANEQLEEVVQSLVGKRLVQISNGQFFLDTGESQDLLDAEELKSLGKNVPTVAAHLHEAHELTVKELSKQTGLSPSQVRYALSPLLKAGLVTMHGGQGSSTTTYLLS